MILLWLVIVLLVFVCGVGMFVLIIGYVVIIYVILFGDLRSVWKFSLVK